MHHSRSFNIHETTSDLTRSYTWAKVINANLCILNINISGDRQQVSHTTAPRFNLSDLSAAHINSKRTSYILTKTNNIISFNIEFQSSFKIKYLFDFETFYRYVRYNWLTITTTIIIISQKRHKWVNEKPNKQKQQQKQHS